MKIISRQLDEASDKKGKLQQKEFCNRLNVHKLVYYETFNNINDAIAREKQIKAGSRKKKIELINSVNPRWEDLTKELYDCHCEESEAERKTTKSSLREIWRSHDNLVRIIYQVESSKGY